MGKLVTWIIRGQLGQRAIERLKRLMQTLHKRSKPVTAYHRHLSVLAAFLAVKSTWYHGPETDIHQNRRHRLSASHQHPLRPHHTRVRRRPSRGSGQRSVEQRRENRRGTAGGRQARGISSIRVNGEHPGISGHQILGHFADISKMLDVGSGSQRRIDDTMLTRQPKFGLPFCLPDRLGIRAADRQQLDL